MHCIWKSRMQVCVQVGGGGGGRAVACKSPHLMLFDWKVTFGTRNLQLQTSGQSTRRVWSLMVAVAYVVKLQSRDRKWGLHGPSCSPMKTVLIYRRPWHHMSPVVAVGETGFFLYASQVLDPPDCSDNNPRSSNVCQLRSRLFCEGHPLN